jgi:hypothetical protein
MVSRSRNFQENLPLTHHQRANGSASQLKYFEAKRTIDEVEFMFGNFDHSALGRKYFSGMCFGSSIVLSMMLLGS